MTTPTSPRRPGGAEAMREALVGLVGAALNEMAVKGLPLEWGRDSALGRAAAALGLPNDETEHQARELSGLLDAIRPLPAGDTLSTGGWNSDMEKAPKDGRELLLCSDDGIRVVGRWMKHNHIPIEGWCRQIELYGEGVDGFGPVVAWAFLPEPPPGE